MRRWAPKNERGGASQRLVLSEGGGPVGETLGGGLRNEGGARGGYPGAPGKTFPGRREGVRGRGNGLTLGRGTNHRGRAEGLGPGWPGGRGRGSAAGGAGGAGETNLAFPGVGEEGPHWRGGPLSLAQPGRTRPPTKQPTRESGPKPTAGRKEQGGGGLGVAAGPAVLATVDKLRRCVPAFGPFAAPGCRAPVGALGWGAAPFCGRPGRPALPMHQRGYKAPTGPGLEGKAQANFALGDDRKQRGQAS